MTQNQIKKYATMLYGQRWQRGLAEDMGVHRTTIHRTTDPAKAKEMLVKKMRQKVNLLTKAISELE